MALLPTSAIPSGASAHYDYLIEESLLFDGGSSVEYVASVGSLSAAARAVATFSLWVKRTNINNSNQYLFQAATYGANASVYIYFDTNNKIHFHRHWDQSGADPYIDYVTDAQFRDTSAWYHIMILYRSLSDSDAGVTLTNADRYQIWVNGVNQSVTIDNALGYSSSTRYLPFFFDDYSTHVRGTRPQIGRYRYYRTDLGLGNSGSNYFEGYMAKVVIAQGIAYTATDFGEFDSEYGDWKPIEFSQSVGSAGIQLDFSSSSNILTNSGLDSNQPNGVSARNGNTVDTSYKRLDTPTSNFATLNSIDKESSSVTLSEGNLRNNTTSGAYQSVGVTQEIPPTGKVYFEFLHDYDADGNKPVAWYFRNITPGEGLDSDPTGTHIKVNDGSSLYVTGTLANGTTFTHTYTGTNTNQIISFAIDNVAGSFSLYRDNSLVVTKTGFGDELNTIINEVYGHSTMSVIVNFGQDSSFAANKTAQNNGEAGDDFYYTPPTGFKSLKTSNLPDPAVKPREHFGVVTYAGNNSARSISGVGFQPDFTWIKSRSGVVNHHLSNSVLSKTSGYYPYLFTDGAYVENYWGAGGYGAITSFDSDGFTLATSNAAWNSVNYNTWNYVAWNWKAGGAGVSNTDGTITSTVSANVDAGFSIISYTGNSTSGATVGHGLSKAPEMIITKNRTDGYSWNTYTKHAASNAQNSVMYLDLGNALGGDLSSWNNTSPTSSVFTLGNSAAVNNNQVIAYAFHSVDGHSKMGSYRGNANNDGTFVQCGFLPKYVMVKKTASAYWVVWDGAREPLNPKTTVLYPNTTSADDSWTSYSIDFVSNGFKFRAQDSYTNTNDTFIFIAFADVPFKYSNGN